MIVCANSNLFLLIKNSTYVTHHAKDICFVTDFTDANNQGQSPSKVWSVEYLLDKYVSK